MEDTRRREEYGVYDAVLEKFHGAGEWQCLIVKNITTARYLIEEHEKNWDFVHSNLPEVEPEIWEDFLGRNQHPVVLRPALHFSVPVVFISKEEINGIFFAQEGDGWERFYNTFPGAQGIMDISQAGFNPDFSRGLVYAGNQSNYLAGIGHLYFLKKTGGRWQIRNSVMVWIS